MHFYLELFVFRSVTERSFTIFITLHFCTVLQQPPNLEVNNSLILNKGIYIFHYNLSF